MIPSLSLLFRVYQSLLSPYCTTFEKTGIALLPYTTQPFLTVPESYAKKVEEEGREEILLALSISLLQ
jgi:hypothetical protein